HGHATLRSEPGQPPGNGQRQHILPGRTYQFNGGMAGSLLPVSGFTATVAIFFVAMTVSSLITLFTAAIKTIPQSSQWPSAQL
ncbi:MAG: hypothetical protein L0L45_06265, partial [Bifidobacterium mongoliense]|nr:hypothetical protein [Bifidobacterium mongoliense]